MKKIILTLLLACTLPLCAATIEWKAEGQDVLQRQAQAGQRVEFDFLKPWATTIGKEPMTLYTGLYIHAAIVDEHLVGIAYYVGLKGYLGFGVGDKAKDKNTPMLPIERVEFRFPIEAGKWHNIKFTASPEIKGQIRVAP